MGAQPARWIYDATWRDGGLQVVVSMTPCGKDDAPHAGRWWVPVDELTGTEVKRLAGWASDRFNVPRFPRQGMTDAERIERVERLVRGIPVPEPEPKVEVESESKKKGSPNMTDTQVLSPIEQAIADIVVGMDLVNEDRVAELVAKAVGALQRPEPVRISTRVGGDVEWTPPHRMHPMFDTVRSFVAAGKSVYLHGPAGTGKTTMAQYVAESLALDFYVLGLGPTSTESKVKGFRDATGEIMTTAFLRPWVYGGLVLLDELDRAHEGVVTTLNTALSIGQIEMPDGTMAKRHKDCVVMAAGNTAMDGADRKYRAARAQDHSVRDRFAFVLIANDDELEVETASAIWPTGGADWARFVQAVRAKAVDMTFTVTPRASYEGAEMLAAGVPRHVVEDAYVWKGCPDDVRRKLAA